MTDDRLLLALLYFIMYIIETEGEEAVSWYNEDLDITELMFHLFHKDPSKRLERLRAFECTLALV